MGCRCGATACCLALDRSAIRTQAALAEAIGADKTRIIAILDELQQSGLIERVADPEDRRARLLEITQEGRQGEGSRRRRAIQRGEEQLARDAFGDRSRRVPAGVGAVVRPILKDWS